MDDFTVADVYEHAAKIGQDIELMIRDYGEKSVQEIMPKIVFTLEQLEGLAEKRQKDMTVINALNAEKERLTIECKKESALKRQIEEKVDYMENLLSEDTQSLQKTISRLSEENELLKSEVEQLDEEMVQRRTTALPGDVDLMVKMKTTIDMQRDQLRQQSMQDGTHKLEIEALTEQTNRLTEINERLRLYNTKLQDRLAKTVEHKVQAEATLASVKIFNSEDKLNGEDNSEESSTTAQDSTETVKDILTSDSSQTDAKEKDDALTKPESDLPLKSESSTENDSQVDGANKAINNYENSKPETPKKDPNRPRYTLSEMQQVLEERNRYKERVSILEEVLEDYVPGPVRSSTLDARDQSLKKRKESGATIKSKETLKKDSKVRGIFGLFWKDSSGKGV